ncbi:MAG: hypothetical protein QOJ40_667 [Verrucomicrobiota bacterium]
MKPSVEASCQCLMCAHTGWQMVEQLSGKQLRSLWKESGHEFTSEAWGPISEDYMVTMRRCERCGFVSFDSSLAGNEAFYRQLESEGYFAENRPEFVRAVGLIRKHRLKRVLDVGCGSGEFLNLARLAGSQTYGLDLNATAAEKARAKGHVVFSRLLHELEEELSGGGFDLITLFQVLEHVRDPIGLMKEARRRLNPGGYISVAVPSENGVCRLAPWDPAQWPPHHLSRWRLRDFPRLAEAAGLRLIERGGDNLFGTEIKRRWEWHDRYCKVLGRRPRIGGARLAAIIAFTYRATGMRFVFPHKGSSIYAHFQS